MKIKTEHPVFLSSRGALTSEEEEKGVGKGGKGRRVGVRSIFMLFLFLFLSDGLHSFGLGGGRSVVDDGFWFWVFFFQASKQPPFSRLFLLLFSPRATKHLSHRLSGDGRSVGSHPILSVTRY